MGRRHKHKKNKSEKKEHRVKDGSSKGSRKYRIVKNNAPNYEAIKARQIEEANKVLGTRDFTREYGVSDNFEIAKLDDKVFTSRGSQVTFMPFSNKQIEHFMTMKKQVVNAPFTGNSKGKNYYGTYLVGDDNGKKVVFALTIRRGTQDNEDQKDFSIKIDMLVAGKQWMQIARYDSIGFAHPNYIIPGANGKLVVPENPSQITKAATPHLHHQTEEGQVLFDGCDCDYTVAEHVPEMAVLRDRDPQYFKKSIEYFLGAGGVQTKLNEAKLSRNYDNIGRHVQLFDPADVKNIRRVSELDENNKQKGV